MNGGHFSPGGEETETRPVCPHCGHTLEGRTEAAGKVARGCDDCLYEEDLRGNIIFDESPEGRPR